MNEKEELEEELIQELQLVQYRQRMLDIMEEKLLQMKQLSEQAKECNLSPVALEVVNDRINNLAAQVRAVDSKSRIIQDKRIL